MESAEYKESMKNSDSKFNQEIHSRVVRAGKRTYFFDVKTTRNDEYYLTITESKKRFSESGKFHFEKHKVFLYKEDFGKFVECLQGIIDYIEENQPEQSAVSAEVEVDENEAVANYTDVDFEDI
ncbi:MAG: DUF3276 family protein [Draconibacterium sp.]